VQPGVWLARNVSVHPTAKLRSPAFLGENSRVGAMVEVGPAVSIGRDCMIEESTIVSDSVVFGGSYIGQHLELRNVVVDRSRLINTRWDVEIEGVDELLLGSVYGAPFGASLRRICSRTAAAVALLIASPIFCTLFLCSALGLIPRLSRKYMVRTPAVSAPYRWEIFPLWSFGERLVPEGRKGWLRDCFLCFLPALLSIAAGHMGLTGTRPRTKDEAGRATAAQRSAFLSSRPGFLQLGLLQDAEPDNDLTSCEASSATWSETIALTLRYARLVMADFFTSLLPFRDGRQPE
jgi:lipopolysaccharide/colanic/teichoic acid biosynthesis glycosyltransferase